jgi:acetylornithine deacetylase/succinyl-diaminopimelate desuccinylase-like protein
VPRPLNVLLDELFDYLRIPSISSGDGDPADLRRAAEWVGARVVDAGGTAEVVETGRNPLVVGNVSCGAPGAPRLLLYGHYDVQTVHPIEAWDSPPFEPEVRDGYIYARGASDDKGSFHCVLAAMVDAARAGELACDLTVVSDGEEEIGGDSVVHWLLDRGERFDAAVVFDGGLLAPGWPVINIGVRGVITGLMRVKTGTRDVHSGMFGGAALNAAHVLAGLIEACRARDGRLPAELTADVRAPDAAEIASWATLPSGAGELAEAGVAALDPGAVAEYYLRTFALPTFDVNAITCRDASQSRTIIPFEAEAAISLRLVPDQEPERVWASLQRHLESVLPAGAVLETELRGATAGCAFDPAAPPLVTGRRIMGEVFGRECAVARTGGAIPLVTALHRTGTPTILTGVALPDDNIHAPNERLLIANYEKGVEAAGRMLRELL